MTAASGYLESRRLGDLTVTAINDGTILLPVELNVPEAVWRPEIEADREGRAPIDTHVLLVQAGAATILVDAGFDEPGSAWDKRFVEEWPGSTRTPGAVAGLASIDVKPQDVTHVLVTHTHFDHVAGLAAERDGRLAPRYPNAQVLLGRADWENACPEHLEPEQRARIGAVAEAGLLQLVDAEREIVPGVTMIPAPGESPGHSMIRISSRGEALYAVGDIFHFPAEVAHPEWTVRWADAQRMRGSRRRLFDEVASTDALVVFTHARHPPWGRIVRDEHSGLEWHPVRGALSTPSQTLIARSGGIDDC